MSIDAGLAALLVRATARVSAVILSASLLVAARRIGAALRQAQGTPSSSRGEKSSLHSNEMRRLDVATFTAFVVSQTIHFICVGLLTIATSGANIDGPGGYPAVIAVGLLFYAGCAAVLRAKQRAAAEWINRRQRHVELWPLVAIWLVFFVAYASRPLQSWFFAGLALVLLYSLARFLIAAVNVSRGIGATRSALRSQSFAKPL
jgi:hypothetical protein